MVKNPILCAAIMILRLVALPSFLTISSVCRLVRILSLVVPATVCLLILGYLRVIMIAQCSPNCKMSITVPVCVIEGGDNRASGFRGYVPQLLKCQGFWFISFILKELHCVTEAPLDVLKFEL